MARVTRFQRPLAIGHGIFFLTCGLWPVFHIRSFEKVTGPKKDDWLVKTVGLLLATTGGTLLASGLKSRESPWELRAIAAGECLVLAGVSLFYSLQGRISKIYLADTTVETAIAGAWLATQVKKAS